jgi:L,D-peptidoglycan transpeptidase YkuD (ErfK/YbiS/YcfS/YnhG family)
VLLDSHWVCTVFPSIGGRTVTSRYKTGAVRIKADVVADTINIVVALGRTWPNKRIGEDGYVSMTKKAHDETPLYIFSLPIALASSQRSGSKAVTKVH